MCICIGPKHPKRTRSLWHVISNLRTFFHFVTCHYWIHICLSFLWTEYVCFEICAVLTLYGILTPDCVVFCAQMPNELRSTNTYVFPFPGSNCCPWKWLRFCKSHNTMTWHYDILHYDVTSYSPNDVTYWDRCFADGIILWITVFSLKFNAYFLYLQVCGLSSGSCVSVTWLIPGEEPPGHQGALASVALRPP